MRLWRTDAERAVRIITRSGLPEGRAAASARRFAVRRGSHRDPNSRHRARRAIAKAYLLDVVRHDAIAKGAAAVGAIRRRKIPSIQMDAVGVAPYLGALWQCRTADAADHID